VHTDLHTGTGKPPRSGRKNEKAGRRALTSGRDSYGQSQLIDEIRDLDGLAYVSAWAVNNEPNHAITAVDW
jgi:hypothetical protein